MSTKIKPSIKPSIKASRSRIVRAVASSTAIETGQTIQKLEAILKAKKSKYQRLLLAS